jgi:hypothetical protein
VRGGLSGEGAVEEFGAFLEADQAVVGAGQRDGRAGRGGVGDGDAEVLRVVPQADLGTGAGGVFAHVGESLLDRAVDGALGRGADVGWEFAGQGGLDAAVGDELLEVGEGGLGE